MPFLLVLVTAAEIILTRPQAEAMSARALEARLLADFPHHQIRNVEIVRFDQREAPLSTIIFHEAGRAAGGRFCSARRIVVTFDTLHGNVPHDEADTSSNAPRRRFAVTEAPLLAIRDGTATDSDCASVRNFAQLPLDNPAAGRRIVETVVNLAEMAASPSDPAVSITCLDAIDHSKERCEGRRILATLDWKRLGNVDLPDAARGPTTQLQFWWGSNWNIEVKGTDRIESLNLERRFPAPF